jgi:hypothetical protein
MSDELKEAMEAARVPDDINVPKRGEHRTASGRVVKIHSLKTGGMLRILSAIKSAGVRTMPSTMSIGDFLTAEQRAELATILDKNAAVERLGEMIEGLTGEQKYLLKESSRQTKDALFEWVCESETLLPIVVEAVTDLSASEVAEMEVVDTLDILGKAIELTPWDSLFEAAARFIPRFGALIKAASRKSSLVKAA